MTDVYVRPLQGIVRMPENKMRPLKEAGEKITLNAYYRRAIALGDVEEFDPKAVETAPKSAVSSAATEKHADKAVVSPVKVAASAEKPVETPAKKT